MSDHLYTHTQAGYYIHTSRLVQEREEGDMTSHGDQQEDTCVPAILSCKETIKHNHYTNIRIHVH